MDQHRENELLLHVAAGTDLPTAFAALPRGDDVHSDNPARAQAKPVGGLFWTILIFIFMIAGWWLMS
jgi:hypothetical protein